MKGVCKAYSTTLGQSCGGTLLCPCVSPLVCVGRPNAAGVFINTCELAIDPAALAAAAAAAAPPPATG